MSKNNKDWKQKDSEAFGEEKETVNEFIARENKKRILSIFSGLLGGTFGILRFYQKKYRSGAIMLIMAVFSKLISTIGDDLVLTVISYGIGLSLFIVVIYDLIRVFKDYDINKLEKLKELREEL